MNIHTALNLVIRQISYICGLYSKLIVSVATHPNDDQPFDIFETFNWTHIQADMIYG